jgi:hypothetical protein
VFVTDVWVGSVIEGREAAHHPWGMPPDFLPREAVTALGITVDVRPSVVEVLELLDERGQQLSRVLAELSPADLSRRCAMPQGEVELVGALQVVIYEGLCHNQFANRDLILCYAGSVANLTLTIDDDVLRRARLRALEEGTSVNAIVRAHLEAFVGADRAQLAAIDRVLASARASKSGSGRGGRRWTREDLHERR